MPVDPAIRQLLESMAEAGGGALDDMSVPEARAFTSATGAASGLEDVRVAADSSIGGVPVRMYMSDTTTDDDPMFLWFHGGGFVVGDLNSAEPIARRFANRLPARVVSVDYRLAPENRYPAGLDDGRAVLEEAVKEGVPVALGGDSAGANIAARLAIEARDRGISLRHQLLVYPWLDLTLGQPSIERLSEGYFLTKSLLHWFADHYLTDETNRRDETVSPLFAADLSGVAPATVVTAEYDPLVDEGNLYAQRLRDAGVEVDLNGYPGMIHAFFNFLGITPIAEKAIDFAVARVQSSF